MKIAQGNDRSAAGIFCIAEFAGDRLVRLLPCQDDQTRNRFVSVGDRLLWRSSDDHLALQAAQQIFQRLNIVSRRR